MMILGDLPDDASLGLLPPSNGTDTVGKGFVEFNVLLKENLPHLTSINVNATIIFDNNEEIDTNNLLYTIDSIPPEIDIIYKESDRQLVFNASDKGSGVSNIKIYTEMDDLLVATNESFYIFELPIRDEPYEIYYTIDDMVLNGKRLKFDQLISTQPTLNGSSCPNNCSNNGICTPNGYCQCNSMFKGDDCSIEIAIEELLKEPAHVIFNFVPSNERNSYLLAVETSESDETYIKLNKIPKEFTISYNNETVTSETLIHLEKFKRVILKFIQNSLALSEFIIEVNVTTLRINNQTDETVYATNNIYYTIRTESFLIEYQFLYELNCYDENGRNNSIRLTSNQLLESDSVEMSVIESPSFIEFKLERISKFEFLIHLNSFEEFDEIEFTLHFIVNNQMENRIESQLKYTYCTKIDSNNTLSPNNTIAIVAGIVSGIVGLIIICVIVIILIKKKKKHNKNYSNNTTPIYENVRETRF